MINYDFQNLHLSSKELKLLYRLRWFPMEFDGQNKALVSLINHKMALDNRSILPDSYGGTAHTGNEKVTISEIGISYLEYRLHTFVKFYLFCIIDLIISLIALIRTL